MEDAYIRDYAIQLGDIWMAIPILVALGFGVWKLANSSGQHFRADG